MGFEVQQTFDEVVNSPEHVRCHPFQSSPIFLTNMEIASGLILVEQYIFLSTYPPMALATWRRDTYSILRISGVFFALLCSVLFCLVLSCLVLFYLIGFRSVTSIYIYDCGSTYETTRPADAVFGYAQTGIGNRCINSSKVANGLFYS